MCTREHDPRPGDGVRSSFDTNPPLEGSWFHILVIGRFSAGQSPGNDTAFEINLGNVEQALAASPSSLSIRLSSTRDVELSIARWADFTPRRIVDQSPYLGALRGLRDGLAGFLAGASGKEGIEEALMQCRPFPELQGILQDVSTSLEPPAPPAPADSSVARLFDMVDTGQGPATESATSHTDVETVIQRLTERSLSRPSAALERLLLQVDGQLNEAVSAVLHDPSFRQLESAWRGLRLLLEHVNFRHEQRVTLVNLSAEGPLRATARHFAELFLRGDARDYTLAVFDYAFSASAADVGLLDSLAQAAENAQTPLTAGAGADFLVPSGTQRLEELDQPARLLDAPGFEKWRTLRSKDKARWVAMGYNPVLLRPAYCGDESGANGVREMIAHEGQYLWGNPAWAIASLAAASTARHGWPTQITGTRDGKLENLAVRPYADGTQIPVRHALSERAAEDLAEAGLAPLVARANRDSVFLLYAPTLHRPRRYHDRLVDFTSRQMSTLPYQLLASRLAKALAANKSSLIDGGHPHEIQNNLEEFLYGMIGNTGPGQNVEISLLPDSDNPSRMLANINVTTGRSIQGGVTVELSLRI